MAEKKKVKHSEGMIEATSTGGHIANLVMGIILLLVAFCSIVPMWHVIMMSLSDGKAAFSHEGLVLYPLKNLNLGGYALAFRDASVIRSYGITVFYVAAQVILGLVLNTLAGYVLSQESKLKPFFVMLLMFAMMFSGGLIPTYMVIQKIGWVGSPLAVIVPGCTNAMFMIMAMNAFLGVPKETVEAARIDGAGHLQMMFRVMLPQARGIMMVTVINQAMMSWNAWFEASIYLPNNQDLWPLQLLIRNMTAQNQDFLNYANPDYNRFLVQYVVIVITMLPIFIVLPFVINKLEVNMMAGAVKG